MSRRSNYHGCRHLWENKESLLLYLAQLKKLIEPEEETLKPGTGIPNACNMSDIKVPTAGRIVHYFPNKGEGARLFPAIVITEYDTYPSLYIFTEDTENTCFLVKTVCPASMKVDGTPYWDWPEIK